ncbi:SDR family oxidoreductase [Cryobacterium melibiosiphilum]|uniref:SDR family oxidoreductase n=1 Tax=Cryobacterium melibiosiphilum TaxID=995039 RepID=A0A3A5MIQ5_9MICO|nr:SDR family oxidoreductase [Cryobacterium melibiosiphilum]
MTESARRPVAVVTGATSGMGWQIALDLARDHEVIAVGRSASALAELDARPNIRAFAADLTDAAARDALVASLDRVDVVVHAAALGGAISLPDSSTDSWLAYLQICVIAPAELTRLCLPLLRSVQGTVIFIGSGAGTRPAPGSAVYTASKHALRGLADVLRIDEAASGVRVSTVAPGPTDTPMLQSSRGEAGLPWEPERYIRPESIARAVRFVVDASPDVQITDVAVRPRREIA